MSNAGLKQFIGAGDLETAQYISEMCGDGTIEVTTRIGKNRSISPAPRRLATIEEVMHITSQMQIVFADNLRPMLLRKTVYWQRPSAARPVQPEPVSGSHAGPRPPHAVLDGAGPGLRFCAWLAGPSPFVMALLCFWVANGMHLGIWLGQTADSTPEDPVCRYLMTNGVKRYAPVHPKPGQTCSWVIFPSR